MPKCINNPNKYYKGMEPSPPKGLGYCASDEYLGLRKREKIITIGLLLKTIIQ